MTGPELQLTAVAWTVATVGTKTLVTSGWQSAQTVSRGSWVTVLDPEVAYTVTQLGRPGATFEGRWTLHFLVGGADDNPTDSYRRCWQVVDRMLLGLDDLTVRLQTDRSVMWATPEAVSSETVWSEEGRETVLRLELSVLTQGGF